MAGDGLYLVAMTVAETIDALGGTNALADALGVGPSAVRNWRRLNAFPPRLYLRISELASLSQIRVERPLFRELSGEERA